MFGSVPKTLWARDAVPDEENRILLATRSLVVEAGPRKAIVDLGCGDQWDEKLRAIYGIETSPTKVADITDVIVTHLHFDHIGGIATAGRPTYPEARHWVSRANYVHARGPGPKERASYRPADLAVLDQVESCFMEDGEAVWPGLTLHQADGHTRGLQWIKLCADQETIAFPSDLMPTSKHLHPAYTMGYDLCAERGVDEKQRFLEQAIGENWIVVFEHDPMIAAARLAWDERGRPVIRESLIF